jgi:hypothetical protein
MAGVVVPLVISFFCSAFLSWLAVFTDGTVVVPAASFSVAGDGVAAGAVAVDGTVDVVVVATEKVLLVLGAVVGAAEVGALFTVVAGEDVVVLTTKFLPVFVALTGAVGADIVTVPVEKFLGAGAAAATGVMTVPLENPLSR